MSTRNRPIKDLYYRFAKGSPLESVSADVIGKALESSGLVKLCDDRPNYYQDTKLMRSMDDYVNECRAVIARHCETLNN